VLRGWGGELLRRDNVDKRKRKKRLIRRRCIPRDSLTGLTTPVRENPQTFSSDLFAARLDDLCGQLHVVYPGRYNYSCGSVSASLYLWREGLYSKAKEETWIRSRLLCRLTRYGVEQN
jgi:hypothetical protein